MNFLKYEYAFNAGNIEKAPDKNGVIALFSNDEGALLIRSASGSATIRDVLIDMYKGYEGNVAAGAVYYGFEICNQPILRESELVQEHKRRFGVLPLLQAC